MKNSDSMFHRRRLTGLIILLCIPLMAAYAASPQKQAPSKVIDTCTETKTTPWKFIADKVMGGKSTGKMAFVTQDERTCLHMTGAVSSKKKNNFIQVRRSVHPKKKYFNASDYAGLKLKIKGNGQPYVIHLKTSSTVFPWQHYQAEFKTDGAWQEVFLAFKDFKPKSLKRSVKSSKLKTLAVVAMTPDMKADIYIDEVAFCTEEELKASRPAKR